MVDFAAFSAELQEFFAPLVSVEDSTPSGLMGSLGREPRVGTDVPTLG
jgi:hypothetical protein